jgi:formylglycine-generating enzyme required for sulfatase activity
LSGLLADGNRMKILAASPSLRDHKRYRPAARHARPIDTSASHVGFRCVVRSRA